MEEADSFRLTQSFCSDAGGTILEIVANLKKNWNENCISLTDE